MVVESLCIFRPQLCLTFESGLELEYASLVAGSLSVPDMDCREEQEHEESSFRLSRPLRSVGSFDVLGHTFASALDQ